MSSESEVAPSPIGEEVPGLSATAAPVVPVTPLPPVSFEEEEDEPLIVTNGDATHDMTVVDYNDKSVVLRGNDSKFYKSHLLRVRGKWNRNLQGGAGWIFSKNRLNELNQLLDDISSGLVRPEDPQMTRVPRAQPQPQRRTYTPGVSTSVPGVPNIPTVSVSGVKPGYQQINWVVIRPGIGMTCTLHLGGQHYTYKVTNVQEHKGVIDTAYITLSGATSVVVIQNGHWQVRGVFEEHTVYFK